MKEIYSFDVKREVQKEVPHIKKTKDGPVETTKRVKKTIKNKVIFTKPSISQMEDADFYYGQKYNEFINAGFLTRAMLAKKMGDIGGMTSKKTEELMSELVAENIEAAKTIQFFGGSKTLDEEQKKQLRDAELKYTETSKQIQTLESDLRSQFSQTADSKAEQKLIEWFIVNFTYYEDSIAEDDKKETFALFEGENFSEKREYLLSLQQDIEDIDDSALLKAKNIFDSSFQTLIRVSSIWYNKMGEDQESIEKALEDLFEEDGEEPLQDS